MATAVTSSFNFTRLLTSATKSHLTSAANHRLSFSPFTKPHRPIKFSTKITATISVGDKLPDATLSYFDSNNELQTTTISTLTHNKKSILFAVPGAFTPTCSQKHLPGFVEKAGELKSKGVDTIACISVNDAFVMKAWGKDLNIDENGDVLLLSDGNGEFTKLIGCELDLSDKPVGLGVRSRRYAMLVEDGVVKVLNLEEGGAFTSSGADDMLKAL
ncbi:peroxiredoxin-2B-like [Rutidosis leptorrhynchoides]|uniref:peroxiredoxin-2B-like n=1 Tax=Rutidosis leptorrhynchoides TaxID=125765 RepID=UPI003A99E17F